MKSKLLGRVMLASVVLCVFSNYSYAACTAKAWPFARKMLVAEFQEKVEMLLRADVESYFFSELSSGNKDEIAALLASYLINTEPNQDKRSFYKLLNYSAELKLGDSMNPTRKKLSLDEICSVYKKAFENENKK